MKLIASAMQAARIVWQTTDAVGMRIFAASIAYRAVFTVLSFMSTALLVVWLLGLDVAGTDGVGRMLAELPDDVEAVVIERAQRTIDAHRLNVQVAGFVGLALSIYGMAGGFAAIFDALNRIFGTYRYTRLTVRYARAMVVATASVALAGTGFVIYALGSTTGKLVLDVLNLEALAPLAEDAVRMTISFLLVSAAFALILRWGSYARPPWTDVAATALLSGASWLAMTIALFAFSAMLNPLETYGTLAFAIGLLLYGYATSYLLLLAALFSPTFGSVLDRLTGRGPLRLELAGGVTLVDLEQRDRRSLLQRLNLRS
ncbi:MAG: YihY/virulence factor BrkB family protein [Thermoleophilia bacterium]|nr:YihY/virulence factor BrkB family protein [Thermoleophilia bacterium]